jgi:hypothetical protein
VFQPTVLASLGPRLNTALGGTELMSLYWRIFNVLARRVVAPGFILVGLVIAVVNTPALLPGGTIPVEGSPSTDLVMRIVSVVLPLLVSALGVALFRAKPFNPEEGRNV